MKAGRPRAVVNLELAEKLAYIHCSDVDIAWCLGVSLKTFQRRKKTPAFAEALGRGHAKGRSRIRQLQLDAAEKGNPTMLIWLGKQYLGQKDILISEHGGSPPVQPADARARLAELFDRRAAAASAVD
jgi:hypothetical protein